MHKLTLLLLQLSATGDESHLGESQTFRLLAESAMMERYFHEVFCAPLKVP